MSRPFTIDDYLERVRELYKDETDPLVKGYWLKLGRAISQVVEANDFMLLDEATEEFEKRIFKKMEDK